eukprot:gene2040-2731_t
MAKNAASSIRLRPAKSTSVGLARVQLLVSGPQEPPAEAAKPKPAKTSSNIAQRKSRARQVKHQAGAPDSPGSDWESDCESPGTPKDAVAKEARSLTRRQTKVEIAKLGRFTDETVKENEAATEVLEAVKESEPAAEEVKAEVVSEKQERNDVEAAASRRKSRAERQREEIGLARAQQHEGSAAAAPQPLGSVEAGSDLLTAPCTPTSAIVAVPFGEPLQNLDLPSPPYWSMAETPDERRHAVLRDAEARWQEAQKALPQPVAQERTFKVESLDSEAAGARASAETPPVGALEDGAAAAQYSAQAATVVEAAAGVRDQYGQRVVSGRRLTRDALPELPEVDEVELLSAPVLEVKPGTGPKMKPGSDVERERRLGPEVERQVELEVDSEPEDPKAAWWAQQLQTKAMLELEEAKEKQHSLETQKQLRRMQKEMAEGVKVMTLKQKLGEQDKQRQLNRKAAHAERARVLQERNLVRETRERPRASLVNLREFYGQEITMEETGALGSAVTARNPGATTPAVSEGGDKLDAELHQRLQNLEQQAMQRGLGTWDEWRAAAPTILEGVSKENLEDIGLDGDALPNGQGSATVEEGEPKPEYSSAATLTREDVSAQSFVGAPSVLYSERDPNLDASDSYIANDPSQTDFRMSEELYEGALSSGLDGAQPRVPRLSASVEVSDVSKLHECVTALAQAAETLSAAAAAAPKLSVSERVSNWLQDSNVDEAMQAQLSMRSKSPGMDGPPRELRASGTSSAQGGPKAEEQAQVKTAGDAIGRELDTFTNRPHSSRAENSRAETPRMAASSQKRFTGAANVW